MKKMKRETTASGGRVWRAAEQTEIELPRWENANFEIQMAKLSWNIRLDSTQGLYQKSCFAVVATKKESGLFDRLKF